MGNPTLSGLWKTLQSLSGVEALMLGFLLVCAVGGALVAIYIGITAFINARRDRRESRAHHAPRGMKRHP
jgi:hypothetical protein